MDYFNLAWGVQNITVAIVKRELTKIIVLFNMHTAQRNLKFEKKISGILISVLQFRLLTFSIDILSSIFVLLAQGIE